LNHKGHKEHDGCAVTLSLFFVPFVSFVVEWGRAANAALKI
jgi:hypothetical protein